MTDPLTLEKDGAALYKGAALSALPLLDALAAKLPPDHAGIRLHGHDELHALLGIDSIIGQMAIDLIGHQAFPVRAILFDKTPATNWSLGWHQDRTIALRARLEVPGYGPWTIKQGIQHVEPPFAIIEGMVTLRIHLDDTYADNAPLLIAPGSHRLGRLQERAIAEKVDRLGVYKCLADRGDIWAYATPILHASAAGGRAHRRVLQVDFAAVELPHGLAWLGV